MKKTYLIKGMHCNSCSMLVANALKELKGVKSAKISYEKGEGTVEFDEKIASSSDIMKEIKKAGYKAEELNEEKKRGLFGIFK